MGNILKYFGNVMTKDARCKREVKSSTAMAKATFDRKNNLFTGKFDLNLRKIQLTCYVWSIAFDGAET